VQQISLAHVLDNELESPALIMTVQICGLKLLIKVRWTKKEKPEPAQIFYKNFGPSQIVKDLTDHTPYKICSLLI
jgi:hypothetical protein